MSDIFFCWPFQIGVAYLLDLCLGDPEGYFHPVRWMGKAIAGAEPILRKVFKNLYVAGAVLVFGLVSLTGMSAWISLVLADAVSPWVGMLWRIYLFYACLSVGSLAQEIQGVLHPLRDGRIVEARQRLSRIVGRDTEHLDEKSILRATIETTAESTVDGIISVLFYAFLGGPVSAMMFKMISTLDSMVGYKNERYCQFGWASAKLDDLANYLSARLGALIISVACLVLGKSPVGATQTVFFDAHKQPSPNSGYPEAAFAGALRVQLGGENFYQGQSVVKAKIGQSSESLSVKKAQEALRLMLAASVMAVLSGIGIYILVHL